MNSSKALSIIWIISDRILRMDQRLSAVFGMIRPGRGVIDVGTDHGYLPVKLACECYPGYIFASDLREGPLAAARRSAAQAGVSDRIQFLLSDGLDACPPDAVDTIVIAGMGGDTICGILDRAEWCMDPAYRLILQPMSKAEVLRYWLCNNGFFIEEERLVEDCDTIYQIFAAVFTNQNEALSDAELWLGKRGMAEPELYQKLVQYEIRRIERRIIGISTSTSEDLQRQLAALQHRLLELQALREN